MPTVDRASRDGRSIWLSAEPCPKCGHLCCWTDGRMRWCADTVWCAYQDIAAVKPPAKGTR